MFSITSLYSTFYLYSYGLSSIFRIINIFDMEIMKDNLDNEFMTTQSKVDQNEKNILKLTNMINVYLKTMRGR